ncbi:helix-turn-helix domain-containing protein [Marinimicrobium locisalis]|uniref:helix-turn-helix domain-containing protein n=1 Tax=Marinimicrobium locisalis TaxID=546022 RepID=UPI00322219FD
MTNRSRDYNRQVLRELLKALRKERAGLTQVELSKALGRPQSYVSKYETGERRLDYVEVAEICQAIGVPVGEFNEAYQAHMKTGGKKV